MNDAGYTLIEVLAAMVMIGLAVAGLLGAVQVMGQQQWRAAGTMADNESQRRAAYRLEDLLGRSAPFRSADPSGLSGDGSGFVYDCGGPAPCRITLGTAALGSTITATDRAGGVEALPLRRPGPSTLLYQGRHGASPAWPPSGGVADTLRAVMVMDPGDPTPIVVARVWPEEPRTCQFDVISQDCR
jgi:prepilin-type N-terminal cleavage/methylation domain-containing protein